VACNTLLLTALWRSWSLPHEDPVAQVLSAFGIFAVGYLMHPIVALESAISATSSATARTFSVVAMATNHPRRHVA